MKALIAIGAVALLGGCAAGQGAGRPTPAQIMANDPSTPCFERLSNDPHLAVVLGQKLPLKGEEPTIQMLSDKSKANEEERAAISELARARQSCTVLGESYRSQNMPAEVIRIRETASQNVLVNLGKLYSGETSFGDYNHFVIANRAQAKSSLASLDRQATQDQQAAQASAQQAATNALLIQQMMRPAYPAPVQPYVMPPLPTSTTTNCYRYGNNVQCTSR